MDKLIIQIDALIKKYQDLQEFYYSFLVYCRNERWTVSFRLEQWSRL